MATIKSDKFYRIKAEDIEKLARLSLEKARYEADRAHDHKGDIARVELDMSRILRLYRAKDSAKEILSFINEERVAAEKESNQDVRTSGDEGKRWSDDDIVRRIQLKYLGRQIDWLAGINIAEKGQTEKLEEMGISERTIDKIQREISLVELNALAKGDPKLYRAMVTLRDARARKTEFEEIVQGNEEALGFDYEDDSPDRPELKPTKPGFLSRMRAGIRNAAYRITNRIPFVRKRRDLAEAHDRLDDGLDELEDIKEEMKALGISKEDGDGLIAEYETQMRMYMQFEEGDPTAQQAKIDEVVERLKASGVDAAKVEALKLKILNTMIKITSAQSDEKRITSPKRSSGAKKTKTTDDNEDVEHKIADKQAQIALLRTELAAKGINLETLDKFAEVRAKKLKISDKTSEEYKQLDAEQKALYQQLIDSVTDKSAEGIESAKRDLLHLVGLQKQIETLEKQIEKTDEEPESKTEWNDSGRKGKGKDSKKDTQIDYNGVNPKQKQELDSFFEANKLMMLSESELKMDNVKSEFRRYGLMDKDGKKVPFMYFSFDSQQPSPENPENMRNVVVTFIVTTDGIKRLTSLPTKQHDVSQTEFNDSALDPAKMTAEDGGILYDQTMTTEGTDLVEMEYLRKSETGKYSYMKTTETGTMTINMGTKPLKSRNAVVNLNDYAEKRKKEILDAVSIDEIEFKNESGAKITEKDEFNNRYAALKKFLEENGLTPEALSSSDFITSGTGTYTRNDADDGFKDLKFLAFTYNKEKPGEGPVAIDLSSGLEGSVSHKRFLKCKDGYIDPERVTFGEDGKPTPIIQLADIIKEAKAMNLNASFMDRVMKQQTERKPLISREDQKIARVSERFKNQKAKGKDEEEKGDSGREDA